MKTQKNASHLVNGRYRNLSGQEAKGLGPLLKWFLSRKPEPWPRKVENESYPAPGKPDPGHWSITFINHSTFLLQTRRYAILTDPIFSERASPVRFAGPRRVRRPGIELRDLPSIDLILLTHNHYDHFDVPSLVALASEHSPVVVTLPGNGKLLPKARWSKIIELDWWQSHCFGSSLNIAAAPAEHFSGRTLWDRNRALWGSFVLRDEALQIFIAGDSAYGTHFAEIKSRYGVMNVSLLPIGAFRPKWFMQAIHMDPAGAVRAHLDLQSQISIPMHYGTFQLADEGIDEPLTDLRRAAESLSPNQGKLEAMGFGESRDFSGTATPK
jgi:L-ascorbate metabolism protein UlaG (beta-lactamase superfamily)